MFRACNSKLPGDLVRRQKFQGFNHCTPHRAIYPFSEKSVFAVLMLLFGMFLIPYWDVLFKFWEVTLICKYDTLYPIMVQDLAYCSSAYTSYRKKLSSHDSSRITQVLSHSLDELNIF